MWDKPNTPPASDQPQMCQNEAPLVHHHPHRPSNTRIGIGNIKIVEKCTQVVIEIIVFLIGETGSLE